MAFNPATAKTQISNTMQAINPNKPAVILQCVVLNVNPERLTLDIFVPELSAYYNDVPISFPTKGGKYGVQAMPAKNMAALVCINDTSRKPYILAAFTSVSEVASSVSQTKEKVLSGENLFSSIGGGFLKQDQSGLSIIGSTDMNIQSLDADGGILTSSLGYEARHIGSSKIGGIYLPKSIHYDDYVQLFNDEIKVVNREEIYSAIENKKAYAVSEIYDAETHLLNQTVKDDIIANVAETVGLIQGDSTSFGISKILTDFVSSFRSNIQDPDFETKLAEVQNFINQYILANKGVKLTIDKGSTLNGSLDDVRNILSKDTFETSTQGNPICFKLSLSDIATGTEKARVTIDNDGNCLVKMKNLRLEVDNYELVEVV